MTLKFLSASVVADSGLGDRQIRVVANSGKADRVKDTLSAKGAKLDAYRTNPIVLADHDRKSPIGNFAPEIDGDALVGIVTFAPAGISARADEYCGLYKAGVMTAVSVGFNPVKATPNKAGGLDFEEWELMELSCVAVPCDSAALTIARALSAPGESDTAADPIAAATTSAAPDRDAGPGPDPVEKAGRALSQANVEHVEALEKCFQALDAAHVKAADVLAEMRDHGTAAGDHVKALLDARKPKPAGDDDDPDEAADPEGDDEDHELGLAAARRKRAIAIAALSPAP